MKSRLIAIIAMAFLASAGVVTQASAKEHKPANSQQCVGPAGFCIPYFGS
jgi:hypothetical protein